MGDLIYPNLRINKASHYLSERFVSLTMKAYLLREGRGFFRSFLGWGGWYAIFDKTGDRLMTSDASVARSLVLAVSS